MEITKQYLAKFIHNTYEALDNIPPTEFHDIPIEHQQLLLKLAEAIIQELQQPKSLTTPNQ